MTAVKLYARSWLRDANRSTACAPYFPQQESLEESSTAMVRFVSRRRGGHAAVAGGRAGASR